MDFETDRLIIRGWKEEDAERLFLLVNDPDVGMACGWPHHESVEEARRYIKTSMLGEGNWAIVLKESNELIGEIEMRIPYCTDIRDPEEGELGFWLGKEYWGKGYMSEAVKCILHYAFINLHKKNMYAGHFVNNENSNRIITRLGFKFYKTHTYMIDFKTNKILIVEDYKMSKDEYFALNL